MDLPRAIDSDRRYLWISGSRSCPELLFAVGQSGTGASVWMDVRLSQNADMALVGIRLPGRESRMSEPLSESIEYLGADMASTVGAVAKGRRFTLVGICFGAAVAYEASRQLSLVDARPSRLVVIDALFGPPKERFAADLSEDEFGVFARERHLLRDWVWREPQLAALLLRQLRADIRAHASYAWLTPERPVAYRATVVTGCHVSSVDAVTWDGAGDSLEFVDASADLSSLLTESPEGFSRALNAVLGFDEVATSGLRGPLAQIIYGR